MIRLLCVKIFVLLLCCQFIPAQDKLYFIFDEVCMDSLPSNFRKSDEPFKRKPTAMPDTSGLALLNASGSAEFCNLSLPVLINSINHKRLIIVDLRQESHGFVNGLCVSWYGKYDWGNLGLSRGEIETDEKHRLDSLYNLKNISVTQIIKKDKATNEITESKQETLYVNTVLTEKETAGIFNQGYFRITATDHRKPVIADVDRFIEFVNSIENDTWLHFHCHAGDGRTTTFLSMYDMMRNAKKVSLNDIIQRQYLLGGIDLAKDDDYPDFDKKYAVERTEFLSDFYEYCRTNTDNFKTLFSVWAAKKQ